MGKSLKSVISVYTLFYCSHMIMPFIFACTEMIIDLVVYVKKKWRPISDVIVRIWRKLISCALLMFFLNFILFHIFQPFFIPVFYING